jgi:hypothetical protein
MKAPALILLLVALLCVGGCFAHGWYKGRQFAHLEQTASQMITAAELQRWATNLLAEFPTYSPAKFSQLKTNYPPKLAALCRSVNSWAAVHEEPVGTNYYPEYVMIIWSVKPSGDAAFEVGPPGFVSRQSDAHAWAPGVYFYRR